MYFVSSVLVAVSAAGCAEADESKDETETARTESALQSRASMPPADPEIELQPRQLTPGEKRKLHTWPKNAPPKPTRVGVEAAPNPAAKGVYEAFLEAWRARQKELAARGPMTDEEWAAAREKFKFDFYRVWVAQNASAMQTGGQ